MYGFITYLFNNSYLLFFLSWWDDTQVPMFHPTSMVPKANLLDDRWAYSLPYTSHIQKLVDRYLTTHVRR